MCPGTPSRRSFILTSSSGSCQTDSSSAGCGATSPRSSRGTQRYEILDVIADGARVAVEMRWRGELAVPLGKLAPGDALTGQFAFFLEIREGRIAKMRNYDCYDPFEPEAR